MDWKLTVFAPPPKRSTLSWQPSHDLQAAPKKKAREKKALPPAGALPVASQTEPEAKPELATEPTCTHVELPVPADCVAVLQEETCSYATQLWEHGYVVLTGFWNADWWDAAFIDQGLKEVGAVSDAHRIFRKLVQHKEKSLGKFIMKRLQDYDIHMDYNGEPFVDAIGGIFTSTPQPDGSPSPASTVHTDADPHTPYGTLLTLLIQYHPGMEVKLDVFPDGPDVEGREEKLAGSYMDAIIVEGTTYHRGPAYGEKNSRLHYYISNNLDWKRKAENEGGVAWFDQCGCEKCQVRYPRCDWQRWARTRQVCPSQEEIRELVAKLRIAKKI